MRIAVKLLHQSWLPTSITGYVKEELGGGRKKDVELHGKAVKVIDLLQHAADLGHNDALYMLGQVSLVSGLLLNRLTTAQGCLQFPPNSYFPANPRLGYECHSAHAQRTGNASSQAVLGFFHSTGYHGVVPVDQAKAQLYLTFAAHGGHKGAQMALGYRYWAGIGVAENCMDSLTWYEDAAEQSRLNLPRHTQSLTPRQLWPSSWLVLLADVRFPLQHPSFLTLSVASMGLAQAQPRLDLRPVGRLSRRRVPEQQERPGKIS